MVNHMRVLHTYHKKKKEEDYHFERSQGVDEAVDGQPNESITHIPDKRLPLFTNKANTALTSCTYFKKKGKIVLTLSHSLGASCLCCSNALETPGKGLS